MTTSLARVSQTRWSGHAPCAALAAAALGMILWAPVAAAQSRPQTPRMSCAQANRLVVQRGAIVLGTGPDLYDRYVSSQRFCLPDEMTKPAWVRSADNPQCFVGYVCERVDDEFSPF